MPIANIDKNILFLVLFSISFSLIFWNEIFKAKNIFNNIQAIEKGAPIGIQGGNTIRAKPIQAFGNKSAQRWIAIPIKNPI